MRAKQQSQSSEQLENRINQMKYNRMHKDLNELWKDGFAEGVAGGVVAVLHPILWIAACSGLMGCGGSKCCPIMSTCLLLVCTVSQSHLHDYQHFADLGTVMVWSGLDGGGGGEWRSFCGSSFSQVRLTLPVAVSPEPVPDTFRWL